MDNKHSSPIYPPNKHNYFGDFRVANPWVESAWEKVKDAEQEANMPNQSNNSVNHQTNSHNDFNNRIDIYENEFAEEITFENIREDYSHIELNDEFGCGCDRDFYTPVSKYNDEASSTNPIRNSRGDAEFGEEITSDPLLGKSQPENAEEVAPPFNPTIMKYKVF